MTARFLQLHTLTSHPGALLNRDDVGFAKRLPFGGAVRVRVSSQCLKRHWRTAGGDDALAAIEHDGHTVAMSIRSRRTFEQHLRDPLVAHGVPPAIASALTDEVIDSVLGKAKAKQAREDSERGKAGEQSDADSLRTEQVTVLGHPEMRYLLELAMAAAAEAGDSKAARAAWKEKAKDLKKNLHAMVRGSGLDAALFGRMVTGDVLARTDAAIHVAHAFTVHRGDFETDYFSAVDDLQGAEETGSGHINTAELTSGLYYGYVVVDVPLLVSNLEGCSRERWQEADRSLASELVRRFVHLMATVSPGAKLGSTAPYARASMVLAESGNDQPRTLANAFLRPVEEHGNLLEAAQEALADHLRQLDSMYTKTTERRLAALAPPAALAALVDVRLDLPGLARWASTRVGADT